MIIKLALLPNEDHLKILFPRMIFNILVSKIEVDATWFMELL
jgi:hypothetical protein